MFGKEENPFVVRISSDLEKALKGNYKPTPCAPEIVPMIEAFVEKFITTVEAAFDRKGLCFHIEEIIGIIWRLAQNTRNYERMSEDEVAVFQKIFQELDLLYQEALELNSPSKKNDNLSYKITCIEQILCKNMVDMHDSVESHDNYRDGMIFQRYKDLWIIIHRINTEWEELRARGFTLERFYEYWDFFQHERSMGLERSEDVKFKDFTFYVFFDL